MLADTLTEAQARAGLIVVTRGSATYLSNARSVPYVDTYRQSSAVIETPAERMQRAAAHEAKGPKR